MDWKTFNTNQKLARKKAENYLSKKIPELQKQGLNKEEIQNKILVEGFL